MINKCVWCGKETDLEVSDSKDIRYYCSNECFDKFHSIE